MRLHYITTLTQMRRSAAEKVHDIHAKFLLHSFPGVTGVDVGYRRKGKGEDRVVLNKDDDETCLFVWVKEKLPESELIKKGLPVLPKEFDGPKVPVDVIEGEVVYTVC